MRTIDGDALKIALDTFATLVGFGGVYDRGQVMECIDAAPTIGGWINNYEWICPTCGSSILIKTSKQSKAIGMNLSVCPVCGKEILYGKTD